MAAQNISRSLEIYIRTFASWTTVLSIIGVFGNCVIIITVIKNKSFHNKGSVLICALACADLISCIGFIDLMSYVFVGHVDHTRCFYEQMVHIMSIAFAVVTIFMIGIDRYFIFKVPLKYDNWPTTRYVVLMLIPPAFLSILIAAIAIAESGSSKPPELLCMPVTTLGPVSRALWSLTNFIINLLIIATCIATYRLVQKGQESDIGGSAESFEIRKKFMQSLLIVVAVLIGTWLIVFSSTVLALLGVFGDLNNLGPESSRVPMTFSWLGVVNSGSNFFIYYIRSPNYRKAFRETLCLNTSQTQVVTMRSLEAQNN